MKKFLTVLLLFICISIISVSAQNPYGFNDEITSFLKEYNVDFSIFDEVFNGEEEEDTLENLESFLSSTMLQTRAYGFNEEQVKALVNSNINSITRWRKAEYAYIPKCKVTFNGQEVDSTYRQYPLLQFRDIVYFPMTYYDLRFLGVTTNWDETVKRLVIKKETVENPQYHDYYLSKNHDRGFVYENKALGLYGGVKDCEFDIEVNGKEVVNQNEEYPLLLFRNVTYFPLTWRFAVDEFGWEYSYDDENGLVINSGNSAENKHLYSAAQPETLTFNIPGGTELPKFTFYSLGESHDLTFKIVNKTDAVIHYETKMTVLESAYPQEITLPLDKNLLTEKEYCVELSGISADDTSGVFEVVEAMPR